MTRDTLNTVDEAARRTADLFYQTIRTTYDIAEIIAFGSRARGDQNPDSDLDLAIILNGPHRNFIDTKLDMADHAFDVMLETGILVQALPLWKDDLDNSGSFPNPDLMRNIAAEGIKIQ